MAYCQPCNSFSQALAENELCERLKLLEGYTLHAVDDIPRISKSYPFKSYMLALDFTNQLAHLAEEENHHPQIILEWGKVKVSWWTHSIKGIHENDCIMAKLSNQLYTDL